MYFKTTLCVFCAFWLSGCAAVQPPQQQQPQQEEVVVPIAWKQGAAAPAWSGLTATRSRLSSSDLRDKVVVLSFWATWCTPCIEELPSLERLQRTLGQQGVVVVTVLTDQDLYAADRIWRHHGLSLPIVLDAEGQISKVFGVGAVPQSFVIDPSGRFVELQDGMTGRFDARFGGTRTWDDSRHLKLCKDITRAARR